MGPLTSPGGCVGCSQLAIQVKQLQERVSALHQIQNAEKEIESMIAFGPVTADDSCCDSTLSQLDPAAPGPVAPAPDAVPSSTTSSSSTAPALDPITDHTASTANVPDCPWEKLGGKPRVTARAPPNNNHWSTVPGRRKKGRHSVQANPSCDLQLENSFSIFAMEDFPPLREISGRSPFTSPPRAHNKVSRPLMSVPQDPPRTRSRRSIPSFTPAPLAHRSSVRPRPPGHTSPQRGPASPAVRPSQSTPLQDPPPSPPTTLIIGDSIVRNIKKKSAATFCFPGAKVADIMSHIPSIVAKHPLASEVVLHVGCNNISSQGSVQLKSDFKDLLNSLSTHGKRFFISGPLPCFNRGIERFSRTLSLHSWLQRTCVSRNVDFIDNFNLFWNRRSFFSKDGIHPSHLGSRILTNNLSYTLSTTPASVA